MKDELILSNNLVPKHEIMKKTELDTMLKKFGLKADQLPKVLEEDPVVKAIGAKKGQVLKITRKSLTAGVSTYYRTVI